MQARPGVERGTASTSDARSVQEQPTRSKGQLVLRSSERSQQLRGSKDQKRRNTIEAPMEYAASASHAAIRATVIAGAAVAGRGGDDSELISLAPYVAEGTGDGTQGR